MKHLKRGAVGAIASLNNLAIALGLDQSLLTDISDKDIGYRRSERTKANGSVRVVYSPSRSIRLVQGRINNRIFKDKRVISWGDYLFGSLPNDEVARDYVSCAQRHCRAKSLLKMDIADFFSNIHIDLVQEIFSDFLKYESEVARILARICTHNDSVPQGALTSSYIANLVFWDQEERLVRKLEQKGLTYTRYVDDITVSSKVHSYDFCYAQSLIVNMLHSKGFPVNEDKVKVERAGIKSLSVHGLRVAYDKPRLPRSELRRIRANVQKVEELAKKPGYRTTYNYRRDFNRCFGRVNKLRRLNHFQGEKFLERLSKVHPLPSISDIKRCRKMVWCLARDFDVKGERISYRRRFFRCHERLNILQRSFAAEEVRLRHALRGIRPPGDS